MRPPESGTAINAPTPAASISHPTPALPAWSSRIDAITAIAIQIPRTNVRRPLTVRSAPTCGSLNASMVARVRSARPLGCTAMGVGTETRAKRIVMTAARNRSAAAPAKATAGVVTVSSSPPPVAPIAWASVFTMLMPAADAASSRGVRARTGSMVDWAGR